MDFLVFNVIKVLVWKLYHLVLILDCVLFSYGFDVEIMWMYYLTQHKECFYGLLKYKIINFKFCNEGGQETLTPKDVLLLSILDMSIEL